MTQAFNLSQLANNINSSGQLDATDGLVNAVPVANGGTGASDASAAQTNLGVPSVSGSGATGTWGISVSGNAATATTANYATTAGNGGVTSVNGSTGAVTVSVTPTTAQVLNATAGASVGAVGTYAFLGPPNNTSYLPGATAAGSALRYSAAAGYTATSQCGIYGVALATSDPRGGGTPAGTWRCMGLGVTVSSGSVIGTPTLWLRIS